MLSEKKQEKLIKKFSKLGSLWIHDGNYKRPHALLTSGKHSDGFFNASKIVCNPRLMEELANDLWTAYSKACSGKECYLIDWIIGSAMGAVTLAYQLALSAPNYNFINTNAGFTEPTSDKKAMLNKRFSMLSGDTILFVEDVITTGGTTLKTINAFRDETVFIAPIVLCLVNRSGLDSLEGLSIVSLIDKEMPIWKPEDCPLCKKGSKAIRPKDNWELLTKKY